MLVVISGAVAILLLLDFLVPRYDLGIDHEMYFSQHLLHGEMLWTRELHDKLHTEA